MVESDRSKTEVGSFVETWVDPENVRQSEVSKKKPKYSILTHTCGIWENSVDGPIYSAETGTEVQNKYMAASQGRGPVG